MIMEEERIIRGWKRCPIGGDRHTALSPIHDTIPITITTAEGSMLLPQGGRLTGGNMGFLLVP
jgi:hypothetical protein